MDKKKKAAKAATLTFAQELRVDTDLRRIVELGSSLGDPLAPFLRRVRSDISRVRDGSLDGVPQIPLFIHAPLDRKDAQLLFTTILPCYPYLREVQLHHCALGDDSMLQLVEFLKSYAPTPGKNARGIELVELCDCAVNVSRAACLGKLLAVNRTIVRLVLDMNALGDGGAVALCSTMRWNSTLTHLSLQYCDVGPRGARAIADAVVCDSSVQTLLLRGNPLGELGVAAVGSALRSSVSLQHLDLANTQFGLSSETMEALCSGLAHSPALRSIDVDLNTLAPSALFCLVEAAQLNPRLVGIVVSERADAAAYRRILDVTAENARVLGRASKTKAGRVRAAAAAAH